MAKKRYEAWVTPEGLLKIEGWARDGLIESEIAHNMGISVKTLYNWKERHLPILQALKNGKEVTDLKVENALLKRALGYDYEETTEEDSEEHGWKTKRVTKHVPGDTTAQIFWLKNRRPDKWRDRPEVQSTETYEDDGLMAALDAKITEEMEDDSWMVEDDDV